MLGRFRDSLLCFLGFRHETVRDGEWDDPGTWMYGDIPRWGARLVVVRHRVKIHDHSAMAGIWSIRFEFPLDLYTNETAPPLQTSPPR